MLVAHGMNHMQPDSSTSALQAVVLSEIYRTTAAQGQHDVWRAFPQKNAVETAQNVLATIADTVNETTNSYSIISVEPLSEAITRNSLLPILALTMRLHPPVSIFPMLNLPVSAKGLAYINFLRYSPAFPELSSGAEAEPEEPFRLFADD